MHHPKRWKIAPPDPAAPELASQLRASPLLAQVLLNRGLRQADECHDFLRPSLKKLHDPATIPNLTRAAERIAKAIRDKHKIVIYGDYDVDGITATSILWHAITLLNGEVDYYIPHRIDEGYGLNSEAIAELCAKGAQLIVTVDCGITAIEQARIAAEQGVDLIITDHHEWRESPSPSPGLPQAGTPQEGSSGAETRTPDAVPSIPSSPLNTAREENGGGGDRAVDPQTEIAHRPPLLPDCYAIVHPRLPSPDPDYPNPHLCGAGVAFKLAWGIGQAINGSAKVSDSFREFLVDATALAALGTIADIVPLVGENRALARFGLGGLKQSKLRGLVALIESAGLTGHDLDSYDVGFRLGPRLNACGRMGHARLAVEMLTKATAAHAAEIAVFLESQNRQRQAMEKTILLQAIAQVEENGFDKEDSRGIVLGFEGWHPGVIGIVASRIVERYHRPVIMVAMTNGQGKGSGRSIAGFHLTHALEACRPYLLTFGGHEMAAGLSLESARFEDFRAAFRRYAFDSLTADQIVPELLLEGIAELPQITVALINDLHRLAPFGNGNRRPLLGCLRLEVAAPPRCVGKTSAHLQLLVRQGSTTLKCIAFGLGHLAAELTVGRKIDVAFEPTLNEYNGRTTAELEIKDLRFVD